MSEDESDVVKVKASNALVPNLTICVDNEENDEEGLVEFVDKLEKKVENENTPNVSFEVNKLPNHTQKVYENKIYSTYEGLSPEEIREKIRKRAQRFSSPLTRELPIKDDAVAVSEEDVKALVDKLNNYDEHVNGDKVLRQNCLYLKGVHEMSTDDIFGFLDVIPAKHIEWINDYTCNVIWSTAEDAARSFLHYTKQEKSKQDIPSEVVVSKPARVSVKRHSSADMDTLDLTTESDDEDTAVPTAPAVPQEKVEIKNEDEMETENEEEFTNKSVDVNKKFVSKHNREMTLRVRFATIGDKKILGAGKSSQYYIKHGNPNYGGVKGILSRSYKRKFNNRKTRRELDSMNVPFGGISTATDENKRMRMNDSDSETEKQDRELLKSSARDLSDAQILEKNRSRRRSDRKKRPGESDTTVKPTEKKSIWARLGKKKDPNDDGSTFEERIEKKDLQSRLGPPV